MSKFGRILEFGLHFGKAQFEIKIWRFSLENAINIFNLCEVRDVDLSQRILKIFILVTYLMSQLENISSLPDKFYYRVERFFLIFIYESRKPVTELLYLKMIQVVSVVEKSPTK
jgi:hypothetical protein